jgi:hypothetical protein
VFLIYRNTVFKLISRIEPIAGFALSVHVLLAPPCCHTVPLDKVSSVHLFPRGHLSAGNTPAITVLICIPLTNKFREYTIQLYFKFVVILVHVFHSLAGGAVGLIFHWLLPLFAFFDFIL